MKSLKIRLILALLAGSSLWMAFRPDERLFDIAKNLDIYASVFKELNKLYVDEVNPNTAIKTSIDAMLKSFDPYTVYYPEDDIEDFMTMTTGKYTGIGVVVDRIDRHYYITSVEEEGPADRAKLEIGDRILAINGIDLAENPEAEPSKLMKGQAGSSLELKILKNRSQSAQTIQVQRTMVQLKNVVYSGMANAEVGYVQLEDFNANAAKELKSALMQLKKQGMKKLILDLRANPGGLLVQAVDICNLFLSKDSKIVETRGKIEEWNKAYHALNPSLEPEMPLVVLINRYSASASEIVAGVIQDYDRGLIVGQKSYGKGLVQITRDLPYRTKMKITTAKYYIPSGRCIQAIDYQHKNAEGKGTTIQDSSQKIFYTKAKRPVKDGGGIYPDISVSHPLDNPFIQALEKKDMIFKFALDYHQQHASIPAARHFELSTADWQAFFPWLKKQGFVYENPLEKQLNQLIDLTQKESGHQQLLDQLKAAKKSKDFDLEQQVMMHQASIKLALESQIVHTFYLRKGLSEYGFTHDPQVLAAIQALQQTDKYRSLLGSK